MRSRSQPSRGGGAAARVLVAGVASLAAGCTPPYEPEVVLAPPSRFDDLIAVVRTRFPRVREYDAAAQRMQSEWVHIDDAATPGRRRVSLFRIDAERMGLLVERSWLRIGLGGTPYWTKAEGDRAEERALGAAARAALAN